MVDVSRFLGMRCVAMDEDAAPGRQFILPSGYIDQQTPGDRKNDLNEAVPFLRSFLPVGSDICGCDCHDAVVSIVQRNGRLEKAAGFIV
ncbi:hypothetical protein Ddc_23705 [Ditylenchus destructor]|nr:hypothetical protein Ddc_23705 [Ditylenchus destructor]